MAVDYKLRLSYMTAATVKPLLSDAQLTDLLNQFRARDHAGNRPLPIWTANAPYETTGYLVIPSAVNGHMYKVTTAGLSGSVEPVWPTVDASTVTDGSVTWTEAGAYLWTPTYRLRAAAAEGWRQKAGMVSGNFDVAPAQGQSFPRSQVLKMCLQMVDYYQKGVTGSLHMHSDRTEQRELLGGDTDDFDMHWLPRAN